jgi:hypothetical protein
MALIHDIAESYAGDVNTLRALTPGAARMKAEREATTVRTSERRRARFRFLLIVLVLLAIASTFAYLSLQTLRSAFGA